MVTAFTLAHLSDPHLAPLPRPRLGELLGKRALGYFNWVRHRNLRHARSVVDGLTTDLLAQSPDHIAITGDLVNIALEAEFAPALAWLTAMGSPHDVTLVPGNHDAYVASAWPRYAGIWRDYMCGDDAAVGGQFPFLRRRGPLTLIGVSSAVATAPFMATGRLGRQQISELADLLSQHASDGSFRVLLIHHPLRSHRSQRHKRLTDARELLDVLRRHAVHLVLHGHDHAHSLTWFDGPIGPIPAIGVPSASAIFDSRHDPAAYNLFRIEKDGNAWRCHWSVRGFRSAGTEVAELRRQDLL